MKSLDELTPPKGLRGIFCDVDDTLTEGGVLLPEAYAALAAAHRAGLRVVPVTGRPAGWAATFAATWPVCSAVGENGGVRFDRLTTGDARRRIETIFWDDEPTRAAQAERLAALASAICEEIPGARLASDHWLRRCDLAFDLAEEVQLDDPAREALVQAIGARVRAAGFHFTRSSIHAHAQPGDHDKVKMLVRLARERWGEDLAAVRDRYVFVGDSPNDEAAFAFFPLSVGVANVRQFTLSAPPVYVTASSHGRGFAEVVGRILQAAGHVDAL